MNILHNLTYLFFFIFLFFHHPKCTQPIVNKTKTATLTVVNKQRTVDSASVNSIKLSRLVGDNMVLQRGLKMPIWGWAKNHEKIKVSFKEQTYLSTTPNPITGKWIIELPKMQAGGPYEMLFTNSTDTIRLQNIMIGDVWVCSGQSNMGWTVASAKNAAQEISNAKDSHIRHFQVQRTLGNRPKKQLPKNAEWTVCQPETVAAYSAVGYYFAKELRKTQKVAIGLLHISYPGASIEAWTCAEEMGMNKEIEDYLSQLESVHGPISQRDQGNKKGKKHWAHHKLALEDWKTIKLPVEKKSISFQPLNVFVWFRKTITLTKAEAQAGITIELGQLTGNDWTYMNGRPIGSFHSTYTKNRRYKIPSKYLLPGENFLTVRTRGTALTSCFIGPKSDMQVTTTTANIPLAGNWQYKVGGALINEIIPTVVYNHMLHPVLGYGIKGVLWYQGESNEDKTKAYNYRNLFANLITDWRKKWQQGDFPFLFVQLPNLSGDEFSDRTTLRASQNTILQTIPNTAQVVTIDIGEACNNHPLNKQDVGKRLAYAARKVAYGEELVYTGPTYKTAKVIGNKISIHFDHVGQGLLVKDKYGYEAVRGFSIAGKDKKFVWAKAKIVDKRLLVWNDTIKHPVAVRYAWEDNPQDANLYNQEGFPAVPFRTDNWHF